MRFDTASATPKLTFRAVRPLSVEELAESKAQGESADALNAVTQTVAQIDGDAPKASPFMEPEPAPAPKPAAKADAVDEPVKRAVKKTESKDVASVLDAWADDSDE
jgi:hypothetical protein